MADTPVVDVKDIVIEQLQAHIEALEKFVAVAMRFHGTASVCEQNRARRKTVCEICDGLAALRSEEKR